MSQENCNHASHQTKGKVKRSVKKVSILQQLKIFIHEGRESGETTAYSDGKEQSVVGIQQIAMFKQGIEYPDEKASEQIYDKSAQWK